MECSILATSATGALVPIELLPYKSIVWEEGWQTSGTAQAVFPNVDYVRSAVRVGRWMGLDFTKRIMYIHSVKVTDTEVWAYGYEAKELLSKCALMPLPSAGDVNIASTIETVITANCPYSWLGDIDIYGLGQSTANLDAIEYYTVADFVTECARLKHFGWKMERNTATGLLDFIASTGTDKTNVARFATVLGNARDIKYTKSNKTYCNKVYALGTDNIVETAEETPIVGDTYSALLDLRDTYPKEEGVTEADYRAALQTKAYMSLIARHSTEKVDIGDIDTAEYGTAYKIGDIISVDIPDLYLTTTRRVVMATHTVEGGNIKTRVTLSEN